MSRKKHYTEIFQDEQQMQYTPWEYTAHGRPSPFDEAKGNPIPLAIAYIVVSLLFLGVFGFISSITDTILPFIIGVVMCVFCVLVSIGYFRKAHTRKMANKAIHTEKARKRRRRK